MKKDEKYETTRRHWIRLQKYEVDRISDSEGTVLKLQAI